MIYTVSDLHGYSFDAFTEHLKEINFSDEDTLYVLGDIVDRGADGVKYLRYIRTRPNIKLLLGNHEDMMLDNEFLFQTVTDENAEILTSQKMRNYENWMYNGGIPTVDALKALSDSELKHMFMYLRRLPLYTEVSAGDRNFVLCHAGLGKFSPEKPLSEYSRRELLWTRPSLTDRYYEDGKKVICGHTPTIYYGDIYDKKPIFTPTWINIDAGVACGNKPVILRLDDLEVFNFNE